jgi:hypothetical protein
VWRHLQGLGVNLKKPTKTFKCAVSYFLSFRDKGVAIFTHIYVKIWFFVIKTFTGSAVGVAPSTFL